MPRRIHISLFATALERRFEENIPTVGVGWENSPIESLEEALTRSYTDFLKTGKRQCLLDIGVSCAALNWRLGYGNVRKSTGSSTTDSSTNKEDNPAVSSLADN